MKILIVSQYFYPESFRINDIALELHKRGHQVDVLTGLPNYPGGSFIQPYGITGPYTEHMPWGTIYRCPIVSRGKNKVQLALNYISFIVSGTIRAITLSKQYDFIFIFEVSPITVAIPAIFLKYKTKSPVILYVQDLWPDTLYAIVGTPNKYLQYGINMMVDWIYSKSDHILCTSPHFVNTIVNRNPNFSSKTKYWPQYATEDSHLPTNKEIMNTCRIIFIGNIGASQSLDIVLEAAALTKDHSIEWVLYGDGRDKQRLVGKAAAADLSNLSFFPRVSEQEIPALLSSADAALLILKDTPPFDQVIPAKLQTYLACGIPTICCTKGAAADVVRDSGAGICVEERSAASLAEAAIFISKLPPEDTQSIRNRGITYSKIHFNKNILMTWLEANVLESPSVVHD